MKDEKVKVSLSLYQMQNISEKQSFEPRILAGSGSKGET